MLKELLMKDNEKHLLLSDVVTLNNEQDRLEDVIVFNITVHIFP